MIIQTTLMTGHKGVDLHAETAGRVARRNLVGGEHLLALHRAEFHCFWQESGSQASDSVARLLGVGRFYNPNKHHYAHFELSGAETPWFNETIPARGAFLPEGWPGTVVASDLPNDDDVLHQLLGGQPPAGGVVVDVCAFPLGEEGPLLSGVVWRLTIDHQADDPAAVAASLVEARSSREGLLVNPHMQGWRTALRV